MDTFSNVIKAEIENMFTKIGFDKSDVYNLPCCLKQHLIDVSHIHFQRQHSYENNVVVYNFIVRER